MRLTVVLFAALTLGPLALAQEEDVEPPPASLANDDALSVAEIASHLKSLDDLALPDAQTEEARSHYVEAQAELRRAAQLAEQRRTFVELRERAPDDLLQVQTELDALAPGQVEEPLPEVSHAESVDVAQQAANAATSELQEARAEVERLRTAVEFRGERRVDAPSRISAARQESALTRERLLQLEGEAAEIHPVLHEARSMHAQAQLRRLETEVQTLEAEVSSYDARRDLLQARMDLAQRRLRHAQRAAEAWEARLAELRQAAAERTEERASLLRQRALALSPSMAHLAASNLELAARRAGPEGTVARLESKQERLARRRSQLREVRDSFSLVFSQIQAAGLAKALGRLLHAELNRTLDAAALEGEAERWREETARVQYERIQLRQVRRELSDLDLRLEALLQSLPAANRSAVRPVARELLSTQRELVDDLLDDYALLGSCLAELARANDELAQATREYQGFLEERILWLRSSDGLSGFRVHDALDGLAFYREGGNWSLAFERSLEQLRAGWWWGFLWVLGAVGIVVGFRASHAQLLRAEEVAWSDEDTPWLAPLCLGWVALRAAPIPWLVLGAAGFLFAPPRQLLVAKSVATGLMAVALVLFAGGVVFTLAAPHGIGSLFRWRAAPRQALRRHLVWFVPVLAVASFVVVSMERQTRTELADSLGLLAFAVEALATAAILGVTLRPGGPLLNSLRQRHPDGLLLRVRWGWYLAVVALPLVLLALALEGYAYSGIQLMHRLGLTAVLVTGALLVRAALQRWITLAKLRHARRVAEARAEQQERASQDAPAEDDEDDDEEREREPAEEVAEGDAKPEPADLEAYLPDTEVRQLIRWGLALTLLVGTYAIWSSSLPALRQLDRLQVYPAMRVLPPQQPHLHALSSVLEAPGADDPAAESEAASQDAPATPTPSASGGPSLPGAPSLGGDKGGGVVGEDALPDRLTVADLGLALLLFTLTVILAKNLPALLHMGLLERLPLDPGVGYAVSTGARYLIGIVGLSLTVKTLGIGWENIQWLAAALTFGLAFGLQEIFANFVSGIIILMERPIRVGDVVTVGQTTGTPVSGTVTRVRMRATTVTDWDNKELIIPNKEFVTGQVINWSLSSPEIRLCLPVGIAYGSDTGRAREILLSVARGHPHVLADPEPVAFFDAFGDSALNFELRAFVAHVRHRYTVKHELLDEINRRFNEAGICIAFPQSDVHLHPSQGLRELLQDEAASRRDARAERDARPTPRDERAEPRAPREDLEAREPEAPREPAELELEGPREPAADASVYSQAAYEATREDPEVAEDAPTRNGRAPSEDRTAGARR